MANREQLSILKQGVNVWNEWRKENQETMIDLSKANLMDANLSLANLNGANLSKSNLIKADLFGADLIEADLREAKLIGANLSKTNLSKAHISDADLSRADLFEADLSKSDLRKTNLSKANLHAANLHEANLSRAWLSEANLFGANLSESNLIGAFLGNANLNEANLSSANFTEANLTYSSLVRAEISNAKISKSRIYGINVWDLVGQFKEQQELIITPREQPLITVDNIEIAQFIYLILNNKKIRDVINTLTSKTVLILGRFALPERKEILDVLRDKLRSYDLLPIVFDFDRPIDKDLTETIKTLAGMCYFVIADVTNPKSSPLELQATVPDYQVPFVPIIQEGELPFAMMVDLQKKYNWVLNTVTYDSADTLIKVLKPLIIDPAMKKRQELRLIKAQEPEVISGKDYLEKGKE